MRAGAAWPTTRPPDALSAVTWGLAKLGRAPPPVLDEVSVALADRVGDMGPVDIAQVAYAFSRSNVPATRLLNRMAKAASRHAKGCVNHPSCARVPVRIHLLLPFLQVCRGLLPSRARVALALVVGPPSRGAGALHPCRCGSVCPCALSQLHRTPRCLHTRRRLRSGALGRPRGYT